MGAGGHGYGDGESGPPPFGCGNGHHGSSQWWWFCQSAGGSPDACGPPPPSAAVMPSPPPELSEATTDSGCAPATAAPTTASSAVPTKARRTDIRRASKRCARVLGSLSMPSPRLGVRITAGLGPTWVDECQSRCRSGRPAAERKASPVAAGNPYLP
jgi:hypothetical protein